LNTSEGGSSPNDGAYHSGAPGVADIRFPLDAWERAQVALAPVESIFHDMARHFGYQYVGNKEGRYPWPSRGLVITQRWSRVEVRITLNPLFFRDQREFYQLELIRSKRFGFLPGPQPVYRALGDYSVEALRDPERIRADLMDAVRLA
jgi:hypothetical protein